jgi:hypothetical protein
VANQTVRISGLKETIRAFNKIDRSLTRELQSEMKRAAEPVADSAKRKLARFSGIRLATVRPRARGASVFVTQNARKVTGKRPDFGALQMRVGFIPALEENERQILETVEKALDRMTREEGF